ncbi:MAG: methyltransferase domain-containing protein [Luteitalea sp.]|nr:methyltransferase domain-containing protein [Luteitalea sp.]
MRSSPSTVSISHHGLQRIHNGHLWIYRSDLTQIDAEAGEVVRVVDGRRRLVGQALYSERSQIALRLLTRTDEAIDAAWWRSRLDMAWRVRQSLAIDATAYRLAHAEGDLLPSLIVDRYGDVLVVQTLSQGTDRLLPLLRDQLVELFEPAGIIARNDPKVRLLEGLEQRVETVHGTVPDRVAVREGPVAYEVDIRRGQKTGLFLDQRENREAAARYARGRLLDCFSYQGGFGLRLARQCDSALALEISDEACRAIREHAVLNGVTNLEVRCANVFDALRQLEREDERFDTIVLDPPAFAKRKTALPRALSGYKEINLRALRLLRPGGHLITCTCSAHVDEATFGEVVFSAAVDANAPVVVVEKRMQSRDHPVLLGMPETYYLKCFILRRLA